MHVQMNVCFKSLLVRSWNINKESGFPLGPHSPPATSPGPRASATSNHIKMIEKLDNAHHDLANIRSCLYRGPMTRRTEQISLHLNAYLTAHSSPPDAVLRELANETADLL